MPPTPLLPVAVTAPPRPVLLFDLTADEVVAGLDPEWSAWTAGRADPAGQAARRPPIANGSVPPFAAECGTISRWRHGTRSDHAATCASTPIGR